MDLNVSKGKLVDGLIETTLSILDEAVWKTVQKEEAVIDRLNKSKTVNEVKPVENINESFLANAARFLKCVWPFWGIMH